MISCQGCRKQGIRPTCVAAVTAMTAKMKWQRIAHGIFAGSIVRIEHVWLSECSVADSTAPQLANDTQTQTCVGSLIVACWFRRIVKVVSARITVGQLVACVQELHTCWLLASRNS